MPIAAWHSGGTSTGYAGSIGIKARDIATSVTYLNIYELTSELRRRC